MKLDWDQLAEQAHPSVFIADVNCEDEKDLCDEHHTGGQYPTILVFKKDGTVDYYESGRGLQDLLTFVDNELAEKCNTNELVETCSAKEQKYADKWREKSAEACKKESVRLSGMTGQTIVMKYEIKKWLGDRIRILKQLLSSETRSDNEL
jgi:adenosyl cobinamide kinase/adenosyl cobinamide phosphate guanylyltransferase